MPLQRDATLRQLGHNTPRSCPFTGMSRYVLCSTTLTTHSVLTNAPSYETRQVHRNIERHTVWKKRAKKGSPVPLQTPWEKNNVLLPMEHFRGGLKATGSSTQDTIINVGSNILSLLNSLSFFCIHSDRRLAKKRFFYTFYLNHVYPYRRSFQLVRLWTDSRSHADTGRVDRADESIGKIVRHWQSPTETVPWQDRALSRWEATTVRWPCSVSGRDGSNHLHHCTGRPGKPHLRTRWTRGDRWRGLAAVSLGRAGSRWKWRRMMCVCVSTVCIDRLDGLGCALSCATVNPWLSLEKGTSIPWLKMCMPDEVT